MKILLVSPRGFCAGVRRAIDIVELALQRYKAPIYVRKEIVHNKMVVDDFRKRGVIFIDELTEAPRGSCVIFSAHGIAPDIRTESQERNFKTIDATCPLVTKVHFEVHRFIKEGYSLVLIGHKDHDEVVGTMGEAPGAITLVEDVSDVSKIALSKSEKIMVLTQTTLSVDETKDILLAIKNRFPGATTPPKEDICYATQNRQDAVRELLKKGIELLIVVGSKNSSNSRRLCEVAQDGGAKSFLIDRADEIEDHWFKGIHVVGVTAGASAPEYLVQKVAEVLCDKFSAQAEEIFVREENVVFALPKELTTPIPTPAH